jgi:RNA-binding protein YlmH
MYLVEKTINKLYQEGSTFFLNPQELKEVTNHLKKNTYNIYKPYPDAEKCIIYKNNIPDLILYEIVINTPIRHQDILGCLYGLKINDNLFGDIVIDNNHYYFYTFKYMQTFYEMEFTKIKNAKIKLLEREINYLNNYQPHFNEIKIIVSSLRIDNVLAKIIHTNRDNVKDLIKDKKITYNYEILKNGNKQIKENDTFSVKKIGKFKFDKIIANTKKENLIISILQYIDN